MLFLCYMDMCVVFPGQDGNVYIAVYDPSNPTFYAQNPFTARFV